jgi:hypothetical protein
MKEEWNQVQDLDTPSPELTMLDGDICFSKMALFSK